MSFGNMHAQQIVDIEASDQRELDVIRIGKSGCHIFGRVMVE